MSTLLIPDNLYQNTAMAMILPNTIYKISKHITCAYKYDAIINAIGIDSLSNMKDLPFGYDEWSVS